MRTIYTIFCLFTMALSSATYAACPTVTENQLSKTLLVSMIQNSDCKIKNLEDVLGLLPTSYFKGYALMFQSHSLQGPYAVDYKNPRVIVYGSIGSQQISPIIMTFNGNASQPGFRSLELVELHPDAKNAQDMFKFFEIEFPEVGRQGQIRISNDNPAKCVRCHNEPAKPIFSSYPFWPGSFGSMKFPTKTVMETESNAYSEFVNLSANHPRYKFLIPTGTENMCLVKGSCGYVNFYSQLEFQTGFFDAMLAQANVERTAAQMMASPEYSKTKYAIAAGLLECQNWPRVLPDRVRLALETNIETLFNLKSRITDKVSNDFLLAAYESDDSRELPWRQGGTPSFSEAIHQLQSIFGPNPKFWRLQIDTLIKQGLHQDAIMPASLRLLMEGRGLRIGDWFLPLEEGKYHTHDGGIIESEGWLKALLRRDPDLSHYLPRVGKVIEDRHRQSLNQVDPSLCDELVALSRSAIAELRVPILRGGNLARPGYPQTFTTSCARCHAPGGDSMIAPVIPFDDEHQLSQWLTQSSNRQLLIDRINGKGGRSMPPNRFLAPAEMIEIQNYVRGTGKR